MTKTLAHDLRGSKRFEILSRLGAGGSGEVFEARYLERGARVAPKTLRTPTAEMLRLLKREFRSVQDIQHPNLVRLGELFEEAGCWFFTMEFVQGVDFVRYIASGGGPPSHASARVDEPWSFDEARLRAALVQLAEGLSALHAARRIHRDIKPSNVLVTREGRVVIVDFGAMFDAHERAPSDEEGIVGTPMYMAPGHVAAIHGGCPLRVDDVELRAERSLAVGGGGRRGERER